MTQVTLTDLTIQKLKPTDKQVTYWDKSLRGFGIRVSPAGAKSFVVMTGKDRKLTTLGRYPSISLKNARDEAKRVQMDASTTFTYKRTQNAILAFLEECKGRVKGQTLDQYRHYLGTITFNGYLSELNRVEIKRSLDTLSDRPVAQNMAFAALRAFLNWALRNDLIERSPLAAMQVPNRVNSRDRVLTDEELRKIWQETDFAPFGHIVRLCMLTGQRRSEVVTIRKSTDVINFPETKNGLAHTIPVTPLVQQHIPEHGFSFNNWGNRKKMLDERVGFSGWVIHDLRRTFSTNCARLGVPIHVTERILNHRSGTVSGIVATYNRHSYLDEMREALLTHERFVAKLVGLEL